MFYYFSIFTANIASIFHNSYPLEKISTIRIYLNATVQTKTATLHGTLVLHIFSMGTQAPNFLMKLYSGIEMQPHVEPLSSI